MEEEGKKPKRAMSPNSLKNLKPQRFGHEVDPREAQAKGVEAKKQNAAERKAMQTAVEAFIDKKVEVPSAEDVLKIVMAKAIVDNDLDEASRIATLLMPYEKPKLAAQDLTVTQDVSDKTDAELIALAKEFGLYEPDEEDQVSH